MLIFPKGGRDHFYPGEIDWEGLEYSKCGRTDKGVSAFGQVIGIRVRSNRPIAKKRPVAEDQVEGNTEPPRNGDGDLEMRSLPLEPSSNELESDPHTPAESEHSEESLNFDPIADEIPYCTLLNRLLPPDIRILAWCPTPPLDFNARFSCRERQYRYFFTQPAFIPTANHLEGPLHPTQKDDVGKMKDGWLNIDAMRKAAKYFEGEHDFRNFCKVDGGKQIENFHRNIFKADIEEVPGDSTPALQYLNSAHFLPKDLEAGYPKVYTFTLHGSAFLWHQVRCMVSILFLVAQGLEKPEIVSELLDVKKNPRRPIYEMATDTPLVLWDCIFPYSNDPTRSDAMEWEYIGSTPLTGDLKYGTDGILENLWGVWRERKIDEILAAELMGVVVKQGIEVGETTGSKVRNGGGRSKGGRSQKVFDGGNRPRLQGSYGKVMEKPLMDTVEVINEKYARRKGFESAEDLKAQGFRRLGGRGEKKVEDVLQEVKEGEKEEKVVEKEG